MLTDDMLLAGLVSEVDWWAPSCESARDLLADDYRDLPDDEVEAILRRTLGADVSLEDIEDFSATLRQIGNAVVQALPTVLPVVGTAVGTAVGGPVGAAVGGALGGVAGRAVGGAAPARPGAAPSPPAAQPSTGRTGAPARGSRAAGPPAAPARGGGAVPAGAPAAAAQLLSILFRPEVLQALLAMALGATGRREVTVGTTPVPLGAFTNLLASVANQASGEYNAVFPADGEEIPGYLKDTAGEFRCDIAVPEERAQVLFEMLLTSEPPEDEESLGDEDTAAMQWSEMLSHDAMYDELELAELGAAFDDEGIDDDRWENARW